MAESMAMYNDSFYPDCDSILPCQLKPQAPTVTLFDDENILALVRAVQETECYTPFIKEELKMKIQERRLASGKGELVLQDNAPDKHEITATDVRRREVRKEQNRRAARRYRNKQRAKASVVRKEMDQLENDNHMLMDEIKKLHQEKNELYQALQSHLQECLLGQLSISTDPWHIPDLPME